MLRFCLLLPAVVLAHLQYQQEIPNGANVKDSQGNSVGGVGHVRTSGGGTRNQFGLDFAAAGKTWTTELCRMDSDCDGISNGVELGDPSCTWQKGQTPTFDAHITHPGQANQERILPKNWCNTYQADSTDERWELRQPQYNLTTERTTYTESLHKVEKDMYINKFDYLIDHVDLVHHFILYLCPDDATFPEGDYGQVYLYGGDWKHTCSEFLAAWAVGGASFCFPKNDMGIKVTAGSNLVLQIHYDNPTNRAGVTDASGIKMTYSTTAPAIEAGLLAHFFVGGIEIPAGKAKFHVAEPVEIALEDPNNEGVTFFGGGLHTHLLGRKVWFNMEELSADGTSVTVPSTETMCNTDYDFNLQEVAPFVNGFSKYSGNRFKFTTHCIMDSTGRTETTPGGLGSDQEMCGTTIFYWPKRAITDYKVHEDARTQEEWTGPDHVCENDKTTVAGCAPSAAPESPSAAPESPSAAPGSPSAAPESPSAAPPAGSPSAAPGTDSSAPVSARVPWLLLSGVLGLLALLAQ